MEQRKPLRKYGRGRRLWQHLGYYFHLGIVSLISMVALMGIPVGLMGTLLAGICFAVSLPYSVEYPFLSLSFFSVTSVCALLTWGCLRVAEAGFERPGESRLRPKPPVENPVLPDRDLLVRASNQNSETQKEELLRAAQSQGTPPEELLRVLE